MCDARQRFLDVFIGSPSKIHDSRIYKLSFISKEIPQNCGERFHLLGDAAYPLREYLLTPYRDYGNLNAQQKKYNKKHCQTRVKIENSFGLLKQRFRQLIRLDFFTIMKMCKFVLGCCVLHNLCIAEEDLWMDDDFDEPLAIGRGSEPTVEHNNDDAQTRSDPVLLHRGELKRNIIAANM